MPVPLSQRASGALHWSTAVARRAALPGADTLTTSSDCGIAEAWAAVTHTCGITEDEFAAIVANANKLQVARWDLVEPQATKLLPERMARKHHVFPLREDDRTIYIATSDPNDMTAEQEIGFFTGRRTVFAVATPDAIRVELDAGYAPENAAEHLLQVAGVDLEHAVQVAKYVEPEMVRAADAAAEPVVRLANLILHDGVNARASDIHIEPGRPNGIVRFRVDGVMREYLQLPMSVFNRVVSRIKVIGGLDIADRMRPHDGRARIHLPNGKTVDLRLSTVPTRDSEKAVIRILDTASTKKLDQVGLPAPELARVKQLIANRDGIVLLTGPTGSGKTTTLYGAITELADGQVNITTIEDPVEYEVQGITQIQIETKRDVTFANTLRAVLRQDPDIVFIGEIRDAETASTAAHAALTGHLVLSTLHTNDAIGVIARLEDLGLDRATIATSLRGAVGQRLVRRLCDKCSAKASAPLTANERRLADLTHVEPVKRAVGCDHCSTSGYFGRMAIAEVFMNSPEIEVMIATGVPLPTIARKARSESMRLLAEVALDAVRDGATTLEEIERVIGFSDFAPKSSVRRVLVVDDDPVIRQVMAALLTAQGFEVVEAADGNAAHTLATTQDFALAICDLDMPGMNGRALLLSLRANPATARLPIIIQTGTSDESLEVSLIDDGADDYVRKPIEPARLIARVNAVLRRAQP